MKTLIYFKKILLFSLDSNNSINLDSINLKNIPKCFLFKRTFKTKCGIVKKKSISFKEQIQNNPIEFITPSKIVNCNLSAVNNNILTNYKEGTNFYNSPIATKLVTMGGYTKKKVYK